MTEAQPSTGHPRALQRGHQRVGTRGLSVITQHHNPADTDGLQLARQCIGLARVIRPRAEHMLDLWRTQLQRARHRPHQGHTQFTRDLGRLQAGALAQAIGDERRAVLAHQGAHIGGHALESHCFAYAYRATQTFQLLEGGLNQSVSVTHLGESPLPYGLGLHPWFLRTPQTPLQAAVQGVWLSGADPLPTAHTADLPATWDLNNGLDVNGTLVDNAFTGWSGLGHIDWPEHQLRLEMRVPAIHDAARQDGYCLLYRPPAGPAFCFEPVTHPIDAFHAPGYPGLRVLHAGESLTLQVQWRLHLAEC